MLYPSSVHVVVIILYLWFSQLYSLIITKASCPNTVLLCTEPDGGGRGAQDGEPGVYRRGRVEGQVVPEILLDTEDHGEEESSTKREDPGGRCRDYPMCSR